jgi:hypothetical protein
MLIDLLQLHFGWHRARITCLSYLIVALFKVKTVNLAELATALPGHAEIESPYRRIQRFFAQVEMKPALIAQLVVSFLPYTTYTLSLDRTNGMLGCFSINFLVLSVVHQGIAFPLFWLFLPKQGNSNTQERMHLLNQFLDVFGAHRIECLLADREFIGAQWFAYLQQHHIRFRIRIKRDMKITQANGRCSPAQNFFRSLPLATYCSLIGSRVVCGHRLYVTGMRLPAGEYVIIVSHDESDAILED